MEKQKEGMFSTCPGTSLSYFFQKTTLKRSAKWLIFLILLIVIQHLYAFQKFKDKKSTNPFQEDFVEFKM